MDATVKNSFMHLSVLLNAEEGGTTPTFKFRFMLFIFFRKYSLHICLYAHVDRGWISVLRVCTLVLSSGCL
jgi:hypothetical protein